MDRHTISWIFLATILASQKEPASFDSISKIADGINHAIPTHKELQSSLSWLTKNELLIKIGRTYTLTDKGKLDYESCSRNASTILLIWKNLENLMKKYDK
jgi:hypothetical protein